MYRTDKGSEKRRGKRMRKIQTDSQARIRAIIVVLMGLSIVSAGTGCHRLVKIATPAKKVQQLPSTQVEVKRIQDLMVTDSFRWDTAAGITMGLTVIDQAGNPASGVVVKFSYEDSVTKQKKRFMTGLTDDQGQYGMTFSLPTYVRSLIMTTTATGDKEYRVPISSQSFTFQVRI